MLNIAGNPSLVRANILVDMVTALGVIFLGAALFLTLRKQNNLITLVALGFYFLEAGLLAASKIGTISLLHISQVYASSGQPENLLVMGNLAFDSMDFIGDTLHALVFCLGAILFYYLLNKSRLVPRGFSLWGLITVVPVLVGTLTSVFGYEISFFFFVPYIPFELVIGLWILVKGMPALKSPLSPMVEGEALA